MGLREHLLRERARAMAPTRREWVQVCVLLTVFVVFTILVTEGVFTRLDQFSVSHLMPWLDPGQVVHNSSAGYWRPFPLGISTGAKLLDLLTYPCSLLISAIVLGAASLVLWRRGLRVAAFVPGAAWVIGNGIEWVGKHTLTRPPVYGMAGGVKIHIGSFDDSFPSGHILRGILVAYVIVVAWEFRWWWIVALWSASVAPALVLESAHTPTDVVGGALVALMLVVFMRAAIRPERSRSPRIARV